MQQHRQAGLMGLLYQLLQQWLFWQHQIGYGATEAVFGEGFQRDALLLQHLLYGSRGLMPGRLSAGRQLLGWIKDPVWQCLIGSRFWIKIVTITVELSHGRTDAV